MYASLEAVGKLRLQSVGVPAISSGVFGFPVAVACRNIIDAISDFFRDGNFHTVTEVHFVDPNERAVNIFHEELAKVHGADKVKLTSMPASTPDVARSGGRSIHLDVKC